MVDNHGFPWQPLTDMETSHFDGGPVSLRPTYDEVLYLLRVSERSFLASADVIGPFAHAAGVLVFEKVDGVGKHLLCSKKLARG